MMDEAMAEGIQASRGNYEVEVSYTGEVGLRERKKKCDKNGGHLNFIYFKDFNINHLPSCYHDNLLVDYVKATSDLTCRLLVSQISEDRPKTWPNSDQTFPFYNLKGKNYATLGTGWVSRLKSYTEKDNTNCPCADCNRPGTNTPKKAWGEVSIRTALHVVYDDREARHTKCQFFYDSHETDIKTVPTLTGLKVAHSDISGDRVRMICITHDVDLLTRFKEMLSLWTDLHEKVHKSLSNKYPAVRCANASHDLCIVVSHPHGCSKVVTVGSWIHRHVVEKYNYGEKITYSYNTPTCPGSSGAPVLTLYKDNRTQLFHFLPPHSQGRPGNDNFCGAGLEYFRE